MHRFPSPCSFQHVAPLSALATLVALVTACSGGRAGTDPRPAPPAQTVPVTVAQPIETSVSEFTEYTGRAESVDSIDIRARVSGYLQRVLFREGDIVERGDLLFVIDPRPYAAALMRAKATLEQSRADLGFARREATRSSALVRTNSIPERQWDSDNSALERLMAATAVAEAGVRTSELDLEYAHIRAAIRGRIGRIQVTAGNLVEPTTSTPLATLVSVDPLYVYASIEEERALHLKRPDGGRASGPDATVSVGFAGETGTPHAATMDFVDNRVDATTGTLPVRFVVSNPDGRLTPGLFARVRLADEAPRPRLLISDRAVGTDQDRKFVYAVDRDNKVTYRGVKLGSLHEGLRIVHDGLTADDRVIVRGLQRVRPGALVSPTPVPMNSLEGQEQTPGGP